MALRNLHRCLFFSCWFFSLAVQAADSSNQVTIPQESLQSPGFRIGAFSGYNMTSNDGNQLNAIEIGASARLAMNYKISLFFEASQGLLTDGFSAGFTALGLGADYFIWGEEKTSKRTIQIDGLQVLKTQGYSPSALSVSLQGKQYFFNGSSNVYPFTGLGTCLRYRFGSSTTTVPHTGLCYDYLVNPPNSTSAIRLLFGMDFST